jgi:hypothetical protein
VDEPFSTDSTLNLSDITIIFRTAAFFESTNFSLPYSTVLVDKLLVPQLVKKFAGSTPDGVMEFFIDIKPSDRTMTLGSTKPLTEMSNRSISWG